MEDMLIRLGYCLDLNKYVLGYTPYYQCVYCLRDSHTERHADVLFYIHAHELIDRKWERIRDKFINSAEYICGFRPELRCTDAATFCAEMLFGNYVPNVYSIGTHDKETIDLLMEYRHKRFNASMVMDIVTYIKEDQQNDFRDSVEVHRLLSAPCFIRNIEEVWDFEGSVPEIIDKLYWEDCLKRDD